MADSYTLPPRDDPPPPTPGASAPATPSISSDPPPPYPCLITLHRPSPPIPSVQSIPAPAISVANAPFRSFAPATISQSASRDSRHGADRLSTSDLSLHTLKRTTLTRNQLRRLQKLVNADSADAGAGVAAGLAVGVGSEVEEDASFWTARGTLRSVVSIVPREEDGGEGVVQGGSEVVRTRVEEHEVLVLVHGPNPSTTAPPLPGQPLPSPSATCPFPSRFLYLFHPPEPLSSQATSSTATIPLSHLGFGLDDVSIDPWAWLDSAKETMERAFWGLLMPSLSGLAGLGETVSGLPGLIYTPPAPADPGQTRPQLYSQETIYTLRMPSPSELDSSAGPLDLGPTLGPVLVKKRSAMPSWTDREPLADYGWGRDRLGTGVLF